MLFHSIIVIHRNHMFFLIASVNVAILKKRNKDGRPGSAMC